MRYLLDANTYIQAKNQYYGMDICPAYWDWLDQQFQQGLVASVNMIGRELRDGKDELADWVRERPAHFISNDDEATQAAFSSIVQAVMQGDYNSGNRDIFLAKGDPWIIAKASVIGAAVVTHESAVAPNARKVKVPNICRQFGVPCVNTFQFLRELNARFVLGN
ncbi:DUF4411 family protein [Marinobacter sp. M3C]|uniref:DUF4411 family protein n=1 Tax=unclassified Marinobacter TaxID=83889 RepID=UPI00200D1626|nr:MULTISPECIES: DUF4411 family protein [unclassified Marinobacter]MCL1476650.1 DUF4411 family protein [Marinobacter sp.]MCL1481162.1 DUF4411 family protein [Marinobacter sp.]MCL1485440.1 DUF4411 family protein [Marinobacter sp.]MCL1487972.1 DUF4411 family protein [Marinobacter sp.]UQG56120.1 DUF4411 family protein [Marinobacter sp. M4C]